MAERWNKYCNPSTSGSSKKPESFDKRSTTARRVHDAAQINYPVRDFNKQLQLNSPMSGLERHSGNTKLKTIIMRI